MKNLVLVIIIALSSTVMFAQKVDVNSSESSVEWLGKKIGGQHMGAIEIKSGSFEIKDEMIISGTFVMDMTSITCSDLEDANYNQKLVNHLKSDDFFGVDKYPTAKLEITKSTKFSDGKATVTGKITIKGKTENISFDVKKDGSIYFATLEVDRSKFDVKYGSKSFFDSLGDKAIDDIFTLTVKLAIK